MQRLFFSTALAWGVAATALTADTASAQSISFASDVRPILSDHCFACHGPDEHAREADLRLDLREEAVESGAIVPGSAEESELMLRISSDDVDQRMPPPHINKDLTDAEIETIRLWLEDGAQYEVHWSFRPLVRPPVAEIAGDRVAGPIDAFLLAKMSGSGLKFSPPADRTTLIRRLYLDLLGVPPTPAEIDAFVHDTSPDAADKLVDRLLKDDRFGERMAVYWLDLVRYADTIGYHSDNFMEVLAYRDYVIDAFNDNMPFDQFTIEQLAGDLLPDATQAQRIASGYNRLLQTTEEGGAQAKEYIAIYAADRVRNVSGVWMGATMGCAQCHDHKYDPFTMRDFYSLAAFFSDIKENAVGKRRPNFKVYTEADRKHIAALKARIDSLRLPALLKTDTDLAAALEAGQKVWEAASLELADSQQAVWQQAPPASVEATGGVELVAQEDGSLLSTRGNPDQGDYTYRIDTSGKVHAIKLEVLSDPSFPAKGFARGNGNIVLTGVSLSVGDKPVKLARAVADYEQASWPVAHTIDDNDRSGWAIDGHVKQAEKRTAVFYPQQPIDLGDGGTLTIRLSHQSVHVRHLIGRFRISISHHPQAGLDGAEPVPAEILAALRTPIEERSEDQREQLAQRYRERAPELESWRAELANTEKELADYEAGVRTMLVTERLAEPRMTRILPRGNWLDDSGEVVSPAVPEFLPHTTVEGRATRLDLARWLVSDTNPLTARALVNRLWKLYFGKGLSRNLDDLGGQGTPPTHPELLDWLAVELRESGWDVKHVIRLIVTSSAYAQSSVAPETLRAKDPDNRLLARQGRWRLEAEFVRDSLLAVSGLLTDRVGGRSVKPYQPAGYWQHLNFPRRQWQADSGEGLYRRSLYTFWCRTFLHPAMLAFDATSREECTAERSKSNIPQQALVLLNDPEFLEASRVFAERISQVSGSTDDRIRWAFRQAVSRAPLEAEASLLGQLYEHQLNRFRDSAADAEALLDVGAAPNRKDADPAELAAWTQVARAIFNLYETTSRF